MLFFWSFPISKPMLSTPSGFPVPAWATRYANCRSLGIDPLGYLAWAFTRLGTHRDVYGLSAAEITPAAYARARRPRRAGPRHPCAAVTWKQIISDTKTSSRRTVPLQDLLTDVLHEHRRSLIERQAPGIDKGWVFLNRNGNTPRPLFGSRSSGSCRRSASHAGRRPMASAGEVVRAMTGHVTEAMTMHYSHVEVEEKRAAVDLVLAALHPKVEGLVEGQAQDAKTAGEE